MDTHYTNEVNTLILMSLMKKHGIRKVIASPGTTNIRLVASMQQDPYFEMYSAADERSAAYMACGMVAESGEPVAISCTGATASRNYVPGLTEAYYRQLPVLAITSTQHEGKVGNYVPQVIDRSIQMKDLVKVSVDCPTVHDADDEWACVVKVNRALIELTKNGGGPVHINLATTYSRDFSVMSLPEYRTIRYYTYGDELPDIPNGKIGIFVGSHRAWSQELTDLVDEFCEKYNAIVFVDHTSGYKGKHHAMVNLLTAQKQYKPDCVNLDLIIHIGEVSGAYHSLLIKNVWRLNPDGEVRDTYKRLKAVFGMKEEDFFRKYVEKAGENNRSHTYLDEWKRETQNTYNKIPDDLPFSNPWIAKTTAPMIPENAVMHFGILSSLRSWNFFETKSSVHGYSNTGGFGIDGGVSSLMGASLASPDKIFFGIFGDLAFFYDMNVLGNRHVGHNVRIMLINNGKGTEFRNYNHPGAQFGEDSDEYIAAARHYGNKSHQLVKHYAEDLGYEYLTASSKEEYLNVVERFTTEEMTDRPMVLEVFTNNEDESDALKIINTLQTSPDAVAKQLVKNVLGQKGVESLKKAKGLFKK